MSISTVAAAPSGPVAERRAPSPPVRCGSNRPAARVRRSPAGPGRLAAAAVDRHRRRARTGTAGRARRSIRARSRRRGRARRAGATDRAWSCTDGTSTCASPRNPIRSSPSDPIWLDLIAGPNLVISRHREPLRFLDGAERADQGGRDDRRAGLGRVHRQRPRRRRDHVSRAPSTGSRTSSTRSTRRPSPTRLERRRDRAARWTSAVASGGCAGCSPPIARSSRPRAAGLRAGHRVGRSRGVPARLARFERRARCRRRRRASGGRRRSTS